MQKKLIPFDKVPQLAKTDLAYVMGDHALTPFYKYELRLDVFQQIVQDKSSASIPRDTLADALLSQYASIADSDDIRKSIEALRSTDTFTVTTAHQPSLFLGPLYFVYKAITTINLAEAIQAIMGAKNRIIPVFVLGSEDHDLDELNHVHLFNKTVTWQPSIGGPVGSIPTDTLQSALEQINTILGSTDFARTLYGHIERAYTEHATFAQATQALLHSLFGRFGLVVLDMNTPALKRHFIPVMRAELTEQVAHRYVTATANRLNALGFKTQASPRDINLFYLQKNSRERIVPEGEDFRVHNTDLVFSRAEMLAELEAHPERFSPNVVLRPLYQEMILPNLAYVGGGGELAYWLERKELFEHFGINYPVLVRRNSVLWIDRESSKKIQKFGFTPLQFFADADALVRQFVEDNASGEVSLQPEINDLKHIFEQLAAKAAAIDPTLESAVRADAVKQTATLEQWQSRLIRAEKQKHEVTLNQLRALKEKLFPGGGLQERYESFMPLYLRHGTRFLDFLKEKMLPLEQGLVVLEDAT
jgi:bacillithiol synthase